MFRLHSFSVLFIDLLAVPRIIYQPQTLKILAMHSVCEFDVGSLKEMRFSSKELVNVFVLDGFTSDHLFVCYIHCET